MNKKSAIRWGKTALLAALGGGIAATITTAFDQQKYNIAHDLGSGKMWIYFFQGAAVTFGALLLKSPLVNYQDSESPTKRNK